MRLKFDMKDKYKTRFRHCTWQRTQAKEGEPKVLLRLNVSNKSNGQLEKEERPDKQNGHKTHTKSRAVVFARCTYSSGRPACVDGFKNRTTGRVGRDASKWLSNV